MWHSPSSRLRSSHHGGAGNGFTVASWGEGGILSLPSRRDGGLLPPPDYPRNQREKCWDEP
jgi:hypothetical protein